MAVDAASAPCVVTTTTPLACDAAPARSSAIARCTAASCAAPPRVTATRLGMRSARRFSSTSTSDAARSQRVRTRTAPLRTMNAHMLATTSSQRARLADASTMEPVRSSTPSIGSRTAVASAMPAPPAHAVPSTSPSHASTRAVMACERSPASEIMKMPSSAPEPISSARPSNRTRALPMTHAV